MMIGSCLCGAISWQFDSEFSQITHCHCRLCRKAHGSAFATYGVGPASAFEYLGGFSDTIKYTGRFILTLKHDQTVTISDRVIANGVTYEVVSIDPGKSWKASTRATLVEVSP